MRYLYEFEVFKNEGFLVAYPFDFEGATQGLNEKELSLMVADWLKSEIEHRLMHHRDIPVATYGNKPQEGGRIMLVAIEASLDAINAVPAYQAAEILGVSRGRVSQMLGSCLLEGYKRGRDAFVTVESINARLKEAPKAGRPKKNVMMG